MAASRKPSLEVRAPGQRTAIPEDAARAFEGARPAAAPPAAKAPAAPSPAPVATPSSAADGRVYPRGKGSKADPYRRADGRVMRSTTVYLPDDVHRRLRAFCAAEERGQSEAITEALEAWLTERGA